MAGPAQGGCASRDTGGGPWRFGHTGGDRAVRRPPSRSAIARGRFAPDRRARRARDRARRHSLLAHREWRPLVVSGGLPLAHRELIITLAARHSLPAVYSNRLFVTGRRPDVLRSQFDRPGPDARPATSIVSSRARNQPTFRFRRRPNMKWRSTSRPRRRWNSRCRRHCSPALTR